jgi:hypothetical protein
MQLACRAEGLMHLTRIGLLLALSSGGCIGGQIEHGPTARYDSLGRLLGPITTALVLHDERTGNTPPLARIEVRKNEMIEFYAMPDHGVLVSGAGRPEDGMPFSTAPMASGDLWTLLSHDRPMPGRLAAALARPARTSAGPEIKVEPETVEPRPGLTGEIIEDPLAELGELTQAESASTASSTSLCSSSVSRGGYYRSGGAGECDVGFPYGDYTACWDDVMGDGSARRNDIWALYSNVCPRNGSVKVKVTADESGPKVGTWTVSRDTFRYWEYWDANCGSIFDACPQIKVAVTAPSTRYNFRYLVGEN